MSFLGSLHELSFYGLIVTIISLLNKTITFTNLWQSAFHPTGFLGIFICYLFWASILFIPIAIICAFATKYADDGEGLMFRSDHIIVIIFAHIAEEIIGLFCTPFWFLIDLFRGKLLDFWKIVDHIFYILHMIFMILGVLTLYQFL